MKISSSYWIMLFTGIALFAIGGIGNLITGWDEDQSMAVFAVGVILIMLSMIPAKLEERCIEK